MHDFGEAQTGRYLMGMKERIEWLAANPGRGRSFIHRTTQQEYLYYRYESHVIYYRERSSDIFIVRVLHGRMLPENHL
jgi:toxin ParE1/3/4